MSGRAINKSRRTGGRATSKTFVIIGDGASEKRYFEENFKRANMPFKVVPHQSNESGIKKNVKKGSNFVKDLNLNLSNGDRVAIVTDLDDMYCKGNEFDKQVEECRKKGFELYLSNPCFEVWLLLHYGIDIKSGPASFMAEQLQYKIDGKYTKSKGISPTPEMISMAIRNAERLQGKDDITPIQCLETNPRTMVNTLVKRLNESQQDK